MHIIRTTFLAVIIAGCWGLIATGQDLSEFIDNEEHSHQGLQRHSFTGYYLGNGQSTTLVGERELMMFISHRFGKISGGLYEMFGLDDATMRMGLDYGVLPWLSAGFGRSTWEKNWDLRFKGRLLSQSHMGFPVEVVAYGQLSYNTVRDVFPAEKDKLAQRLTYSGQLLITRKFKRFALQLAPVYLYSVYDPVRMGPADLLSLGMGASVGVTRRLDLTVEYYAGLIKPDDNVKNPLTVGLDFDTGGHLFQLVVGNAQGMFDKAFLLHTSGTWADGSVYFGFNLIRVFYP